MTLTYVLPADRAVEMRITDLLGYRVVTFQYAAGAQGGSMGVNQVQWNLEDARGATVEPGVYVVSIRPSGAAQIRARILVTRN